MNLEVVSDYSYCGSSFVTTQDPAGYYESERTSLVEQHRPINQNPDLIAYWKNLIGLQKHTAAADVPALWPVLDFQSRCIPTAQ
jgi:hypothetical protein